MKSISIFLIILVFGTCILNTVNCAKILSVFGFPGPSQYIYIAPLLKALAERGHEVTSISTFPQKKPLKNFRDIYVVENSHLFDNITTASAEGERKSYFAEFTELARIGSIMTTNVLEHEEVKLLMAKEKFDLIIVEIFACEALLGWGEHFKAPMVGVSTFGTANFVDDLVGNTSPPSYIPHMGVSYGNHMTLMERTVNALMCAIDNIYLNYVMLPYQEKLYKKYFPKAQLSFDGARKNVSLVLLNDHFSLRAPRPYVPNMIEAGGLHIKQNPDPLPSDLQTFLDNASEGVIYFSLGSNVKSKDLPKDKLKAILEAFRELKLKVLWKFEMDELPNKPANVIIKKWYPQPSILAHPNVKLFISHGGYLSTTETIFHGKPVLGIPMLGDQFMNVKNAVKAGYALSIKFEDLTKESLKENIMKLWTNPQYTEAVQRLSRYFRDQPLSPLDTAIYWVEYVLRHQGAVHLQNAGTKLSFIQYHNIDVYALLLGALLLCVGLIASVAGLIKKAFNGNQTNSRKVKSH